MVKFETNRHFANTDVDDLNYLVGIELRKCIIELILPRKFTFFHFLSLLSTNKVGLKP